MNQLAQFLMSQRPGTIGNPAQSSPAQYQVDILKAQRDQELADQMMHAGYVQNSGGLGVLASALSSLVGAKLGQGANDSLSTALQAKFEDDNARALAARQRELDDEKRKWDREDARDKAKREADAAAKAAEPFTLTPGGVRFGADGKQLAAVPKDPDKPTEEARNFAMYSRMSPEDRARWDQMHGRSSLGAAGTTEGAPLTGDDFLKTLDPGLGNLVKAIAEGRQAMPNARSAQGIRIAQMVQQYDPSADAVTLKQRMDTAHDFSPGGTSGKSVKAIEQLSSHLEALDESMKNLHNWGMPAANYVLNSAAEQFGSGKTTAFNLNAKAVADELTKAWRGSAGAEADIKAWKESLTPNMSPDQQKAAMQKLVELVNGADQALQDSYARGMRLNDTPQSFLTPKTRAILDRLGGKKAAAPTDAPTAAPAPPQGISIRRLD